MRQGLSGGTFICKNVYLEVSSFAKSLSGGKLVCKKCLSGGNFVCKSDYLKVNSFAKVIIWR